MELHTIRLASAQLCPDCDLVYEAQGCPKCGSENGVWIDKALAAIKPNGGCWEFKECPHNFGYGRILRNRKHLYAHRFMYRLFVGPIPTDCDVDHVCRNVSCVNPAHLEAVPHAENVRRGNASKLRRGEAEQLAKIAIHTRTPLDRLAALYGLSRREAQRIKNGRAFPDRRSEERPRDSWQRP